MSNINDFVIEIGAPMFPQAKALKKYTGSDSKVIVDGGIDIIFPEAFYGGRDFVKEIIVADGVKAIWADAFARCVCLERVEIADSVTSIRDGIFSGCSALKCVKLPNGLDGIKKSMFANCKSLENVVFPDNVEAVSQYAFSGCSAMKEITLPASITYVGDYAFSKCSNLREITIMGPDVNVCDCAFNNCDQLEKIVFCGNIRKIGSSLLSWQNKVRDIVVPTTMSEMGFACWKEAFGEALTYIIGLSNFDAMSKINKMAKKNFEACFTALLNKERVDLIPRFLNLWKKVDLTLLELFIQKAVEKENAEITALLMDYKTKNYSASQVEEKKNDELEKSVGLKERTVADWKKIFRFVKREDGIAITGYIGNEAEPEIPAHIGKDKVVELSKKAFEGNRVIKKITIPESVYCIGASTFKGCVSLEEIVFPSAVREIPDSAFQYCRALTTVLLSDSTEAIGVDAFDGCDSLKYNVYEGAKYLGSENNPHLYLAKAENAMITSCVMSDDAVILESAAFNGCKLLEKVSVSGKIKVVPKMAFANCKSMREIVLPAGVVEIGAFAFVGCKALKGIDLGKNVTKIGATAFKDCSSLTDITIPDTVKELGDYAFAACKSLVSVNIGAGVSTIPASCFDGCKSLVKVVLPEQITKVGVFAFRECKTLESIVVPESVREVGCSAFALCAALKSVTIKNKDTKIESNAFASCPNLTIYTSSNSYVEKFATDNGITFEVI